MNSTRSYSSWTCACQVNSLLASLTYSMPGTRSHEVPVKPSMAKSLAPKLFRAPAREDDEADSSQDRDAPA